MTIQLPPEPVLEVLIQSEPADGLVDAHVPADAEPVLEVLIQSEPVDGLVDAPGPADAEPVGHGKVQKKWGPTGPGKKFRSINKLCDVEPSSGKKCGKKKQKK